MKDETKVFSVRTDLETIETLDKIMELKGLNRNSVMNKLINDFIVANIPNRPEFKPIPINDNINELGYKRGFLSSEDAEFLYGIIMGLENKDRKRFPIFSDAEIDAQKSDEINTLIATAVKYEFTQVNIIIYHYYDFSENVDNFGNRILDLLPITLLYKTDTREVEEITNADYIRI